MAETALTGSAGSAGSHLYIIRNAVERLKDIRAAELVYKDKNQGINQR